MKERATTVPVFLALLLLAAPAAGSPPVAAGGDQVWNFRVLLDDSEIGFHRFRLTENDGQREVYSEARFDVRFLFVTAYRYRHETTEYWSDGCLSRIASRTVTNGDEVSLNGRRSDEGFIVETGDSDHRLPKCVMTFAYWNPAFLDESHLLNPQSGRYMEVDAAPVKQERLDVRGESVLATRYRLRSDELTLDVWYSETGEWLALESIATGGRKLRYELS